MNCDSFATSIYERILQNVGDGAVILDPDGTVNWANRSACELFGDGSDLRGRQIGQCLSESDQLEQMLKISREEGCQLQTFIASVPNAETQLAITVHPRAAGEPCTLVVKPFHAAVSNFDRAIRFATRDSVTGLQNRDTFEETLTKARSGKGSVTVMCVSVDQFSMINDVYGRAQGDRLLRSVAHHLRLALGPELPIARLYGGRFALFLCSCDKICTHATQCSQSSADACLAKINAAFRSPFVIHNIEHTISASVGVATSSPEADGNIDLLACAETAVRLASTKEVGGKVCNFLPSMMADRQALLQIETDLYQAIQSNELKLVYQPKVRWIDRTVVGFEALARWTHPTKGPISPSIFVPVAEKCGLITELGRWAVREACRQMAEWSNQGFDLLPVAVNVSPRHILVQSLSSLLAPLAEYGLADECIEIEITESAFMDRVATTQGVVEALQSSGIHISIDDFGTGHSSLSNLRRLPVKTLKIDGSFVEDIETSQEARDIIATIIAMAKALSLNIIAEGVETQSQAELLHRLGAPVMQGYLFARPMSHMDACAILDGKRELIN